MTKEEFDASPKRICLLCSANILVSYAWKHFKAVHPNEANIAFTYEDMYTEPFGPSTECEV